MIKLGFQKSAIPNKSDLATRNRSLIEEVFLFSQEIIFTLMLSIFMWFFSVFIHNGK